MEEKLTKLKDSLDKTIYKDIKFEQRMQERTIDKVYNKRKRKNYTPLVASLLAVAVALILFFNVSESFDKRNLASVGIGEETEEASEKQSVNYLFVTHIEESGPSIILMNLNKETGSAKYITIPKNLYINDKYYEQPMTKEAVEEAFAIKVSKVVDVDPNMLGSYIEKNNGIEIINEFDFKQSGSEFKEGKMRLTEAEQLVDYMNMRKSDPMGGIGRNNRIASVMEELFRHDELLLDVLNQSKLSDFDKVLQSAQGFINVDEIQFEYQFLEQENDNFVRGILTDESQSVFRETFGGEE
ncbi:hypothetical protein CHH83_06990 [Bacillus sp. 7586-K]|nr:hypothetical protein CHH83_06990 [Bacillus sp. 7586-K]